MGMENEGDITDKYLLGELSLDQEKRYLEQVKENSILAVELKERKSLIQGIEYYNQEQLRQRLQRIQEESDASGPNWKIYLLPGLAIAASLLLLTIAFNFWSTNLPQEPSKIYSNYFEPYPIQIATRSSANQKAALVDSLYNQKAYKKAFPEILKVLEEKPNDPVWLLAAATCMLESGLPDKAISYLQIVIDSKDVFYQDQAIWYKGLALLKMDQPVQAKDSFRILASDPDRDFSEKANKLLSELD